MAHLNFEAAFLFGVDQNGARLQPDGRQRLSGPARRENRPNQKVWAKARVPFVWEKVQITASSESEIATFLPVTLHHVAALVEPSLLDHLRRKVNGALKGGEQSGKAGATSDLHDSPSTTLSVANVSLAASTAVAQDWRRVNAPWRSRRSMWLRALGIRWR